MGLWLRLLINSEAVLIKIDSNRFLQLVWNKIGRLKHSKNVL